jgi:MFS family permease
VPGRYQKITLLVALYLAQGLPYGFFTDALKILLRQAGLSLTAISAFSLLSLPWLLKFLWAPYLDHVGTRRRWLLVLQSASVVTALLLAGANLEEDLTLLIVAAFAFNLIAASQDIVTDGLAVRLLDTRERGLANGIQVGAYRIGMILGGSVLLFVFARTGWGVMFFSMAGMLALTLLPVFGLREEPRPASASYPSAAQMSVLWLRRLLRPGVLGFAALIFCYRFGDQMLSSLVGLFMNDQGLGLETIALLRGTGSATSVVGALFGGWLTFSAGRRKAVLISGVAQAGSFVLYIAAALGFGGLSLIWAATIVEGVIGTMATVALFTLMMDASEPEHAGTDYTLLASIVIVVNYMGNIAGAVLADAVGYAPTFIVSTLLALLGCLAVVFVLDRKPMPERIALAWAPK